MDARPSRRTAAGRLATAGRLAMIGVIALVALTGCQPEPEPGSTATPTPSVSRTATPTPSETAAPTPTPSETSPAEASVVPGDCEDAYSGEELAHLRAVIPPLNDPGITMLSTQNAALLEILDGAQTRRCTWGAPSEYGLSTNISEVDAATAASVVGTLRNAGFSCAPLGDGTICTIEQRGITQDDVEYANGESHYVGGGGWVATNWLNADIAGYTEDIVATIWG